ncbi:MAG: 23S rRNA (adenine(2503)-C(2))-methyltransferase [Elusimicrobia bacterium GWA2_56_46]|nr:MAG: 23S rRNA (adenine(2503)-C(2))-methyltransferase [Elusimicrobia bacterium GWA2_56_46]OGR55853.1 MAG: 23S rRNA (adenine(2503)-C(2))-methyltransferase [Elusimicrobia bacterium GWC2_56_31]HBB65963.1 23S rRNA (adenine(2503)-C(2))-methyltransferase RlmN [Elusimicrobiota bacterium]HBW22214.1 23S rRNA (adenine(2503)-C(2))-methyltransferase RlmN [Elusimicrobiota bacterium]
MDIKKIAAWLEETGQPKFRLRQITDAVYKRGAASFEEITALPEPLRNALKEKFRVLSIEPETILESRTGNAVKGLFRLKDKHKMESVLLNLFPGKWSVCVSTQVGCPVQCVFCATGRRGLQRNLSPDEIVSQYVFWANYLKIYRPGEKIGGLVYMGMGEPFLNYESTAESLRTLTDPGFIGLGDRHISVSTVGHVPGIRRFAKDFPQINLAVSLHAVEDELRSRLVPLNDKYPLAQISKALQDYIYATKRKVFIEYVMLGGVNDSQSAARRLSEWLRGVAAPKSFTVNLIPYNSTAHDFKSPGKERVEAFSSLLLTLNISCTVRKSLGADIIGACGQLAGK